MAPAAMLTLAEIDLVLTALDSHEYWELTDPHQRSSGYSTVEDGESPEIDAVRTLACKLRHARQELCTTEPRRI